MGLDIHRRPQIIIILSTGRQPRRYGFTFFSKPSKMVMHKRLHYAACIHALLCVCVCVCVWHILTSKDVLVTAGGVMVRIRQLLFLLGRLCFRLRWQHLNLGARHGSLSASTARKQMLCQSRKQDAARGSCLYLFQNKRRSQAHISQRYHRPASLMCVCTCTRYLHDCDVSSEVQVYILQWDTYHHTRDKV